MRKSLPHATANTNGNGGSARAQRNQNKINKLIQIDLAREKTTNRKQKQE